jgi:hypothetical protein
MTKTLNASQMWRSDKDLWQYSYENEKSPFTSIILGAYLFKYNEKVALDFMVWGVKNYDIRSNKLIFYLFMENIYKSTIPIQKKIQILNECYTDHQLYREFLAVALLEGTEDQMNKGIEILKPDMKFIDTFEKREVQGISTVKAIKSLCLRLKSKERACIELNVEY